jgi:hypothetical protein
MASGGADAAGGSSGTGGQPRSCGTVAAGTDIWNLPSFQVTAGPYKADWKALGEAYSTPQWWRDAKLGAWAHWDPQSMPEQGDWYALRMYQQNSADYNYHLSHFGDPSEYGYKDSTEAATESAISAYPFQTELDIQNGNWHYMPPGPATPGQPL